MKMQTNRKAAIKKLRSLVLTPRGEVGDFRDKIEETFSAIFLPNHVERTECDYDGVRCDVLVPELSSANRVMIYVHGASFAGGSRNSYRTFCASLANDFSSRVVVPEFRLPPTHPFPAGIDDIFAVFQAIHAEATATKNSGQRAQIILCADGSGASLALAVLFRLPESCRADISHLILFSPWLDMGMDSDLLKSRHKHDEVLSSEDLHRAVDLYTYASNFTSPLVSPLRAAREDFAKFPEVYIQMGGTEILLGQARQFQKLLRDADIPVTLDVWDDMMYLFQMADEYVPEAHMAIQKIGRYLNRRAVDDDAEAEAERQEILRKNNIVVD